MNRNTPTSSTAAYRVNSMVMLVLMLALTALLGWASTRYTAVFDWTRTGRHSLSDASISVLERIEGPVTVVSYAREQTDLRMAIGRFIDMFRRVKPDLEFRFQNPDTVPDEIRDLGVSINGELVIQYQGRTTHVREANEGSFINALLRLSRDKETWIAFIEGHGERNPLGKANHDLGDWGTHLVNRGYRIRPLNLAEMAVIPDNTSVLVLAGPRVALLPGETSVLLEYLQRGGNLLWLLDPGDGTLTQPIADYLKIKVADGTLVDVAGQLIGINDPTITMVTTSLYGDHAAVKDFTFTTLFPRAAALTSMDTTDWRVTPMLNTGDHTWLESGPLDENSRYDEDTDQKGPLTIGLALERRVEITNANSPGAKLQKIVIVADGDFLSNQYLGNSGNLDLGLRFINWLGDNEDLIDIPARIATDTQLSASPIMTGVIGIGFLLVLPLLLTLTGLTIWWRRKRS